jgi:hypothetical protein
MRAIYFAAIVGLVACDRAQPAPAPSTTESVPPPAAISEVDRAGEPVPADNDIVGGESASESVPLESDPGVESTAEPNENVTEVERTTEPAPASNNISEIGGARGNQVSEMDPSQGDQPSEIDGPAGNNISEMEDPPEPPSDPISDIR